MRRRPDAREPDVSSEPYEGFSHARPAAGNRYQHKSNRLPSHQAIYPAPIRRADMGAVWRNSRRERDELRQFSRLTIPCLSRQSAAERLQSKRPRRGRAPRPLKPLGRFLLGTGSMGFGSEEPAKPSTGTPFTSSRSRELSRQITATPSRSATSAIPRDVR